MLIDFALLLLSFAFFLVLGKHVFHLLFAGFREKSVSGRAVQFFFCLTLALTFSMFELVLLEIFDVLEHDSRWLCWRLDLNLFLVLVVFIQPLLIIFIFIESVMKGLKKWLITLLLFIVHLSLFYQMGVTAGAVSQKKHGLFSKLNNPNNPNIRATRDIKWMPGETHIHS